MVGKRAYRRICVNDIDRNQLVEAALAYGSTGTVMGLDIAKNEIVACVRWGQGCFERPWKIVNTAEIGLLIELCLLLKSKCDGFSVGLESTGTYGDAVRFALTEAAISVQRVSGKAVSDYMEIFDGVPSQHDGKDAAMVAELVAMGKGTLWPYSALSENMQVIKHQVRRIDTFRNFQTQWLGRLEAQVARHWPELTSQLRLSSVTLLKMLEAYGSPANAIADPNLTKKLTLWGKVYLTEEKMAKIVASANSTVGLPMNESEVLWVKEIAGEALNAHRAQNKCERVLREQIARDPVMTRYGDAIGVPTLAVIWTEVGDPCLYGSSGAFIKAIGMNLKERSSGKRKGELAISKRGPALARRWIYFWAMRAVQRDELKGWYAKFIQVGNTKSSSEHRKMKGLIALMRKLSKSLWHARVNNKNFDYSRVIESKPIQARRRRRKAVTAPA
jgi:transposase